MFIDGIAISNFRSFGDESQEIGPFGKINVFVGQNNAGKSNILLFMHKYFKSFMQNLEINYSTGDYHTQDKKETKTLRVGIGMSIDGDLYKNKIAGAFSKSAEDIERINAFLSNPVMTNGSKVAWFYYSTDSHSSRLTISRDFITKIENALNFNQRLLEYFYHQLTGQPISGPLRGIITNIVNWLSPLQTPGPTIALIPAIRQIVEGDTNQFNGRSIYQRIAELQNPVGSVYDISKKKFERINEFIKDVTGEKQAEIEVPHDRNTIYFKMNEKVLPLQSLGTGLHEVVILAAEATVLSGQVVCIEEPELHLHPILQKKLINYLLLKTDNQYFITTHSNAFVNINGVDVFHVTNDGKKTNVTKAISSLEKNNLLDDLGYYASDLLQTNYVLWVEGPSDRIYIRFWIEKMDKRLKEGIHYSIMFYGGRLRSHLSVSDNDIQEFIKLSKINRNSGIVQDSDKKKKTDTIDQTKQRLIAECSSLGYFSWLTEGREIENYFQEDVFKSAFYTITGFELEKYGKFEKMTQYHNNPEKKIKTVDKVELAREITKQEPVWKVLDLRIRIEELVNKICEANNLEIPKPEKI